MSKYITFLKDMLYAGAALFLIIMIIECITQKQIIGRIEYNTFRVILYLSLILLLKDKTA